MNTDKCPHVMSKFASQLQCLHARDEWHMERVAELERELAECAAACEVFKKALHNKILDMEVTAKNGFRYSFVRSSARVQVSVLGDDLITHTLFGKKLDEMVDSILAQEQALDDLEELGKSAA